MNRAQNRNRRGFTLTELAIVLGIIGIVLGSIWVAAQQVYWQRQLNAIETDLRVIASNANQLYRYSGQDNAPGGSDWVANHYQIEIQAGMFPGDFLESSTVDMVDAGGGSFFLELPTAFGFTFWDGWYNTGMPTGGAPTSTFVYEEDLINIPDSVCTRLVTDFSGVGGVVDIVVNATTEWGSIYGGTSAYIPNISPSTAAAACYTGGSGTAQVWLIFASY